MSTQITSNDLQQKIQGYLETLALETDQARKSEEMQRYLDFVSRFHQYSPSNIFLIMLTKPDATHVAGFQAWKKMGRYVKKGEHGIPILAPMIHKEDPDRDDSPKVLSGSGSCMCLMSARQMESHYRQYLTGRVLRRMQS